MENDSKTGASGAATDRPQSAPKEKDLAGRVALVAGATRGAGRAIARALGERGATVYCTGRTTRITPGSRPETIEETAELVTSAGGRGIARRVDHTRPGEVEALCAEIGKTEGGIDILVNDIWGGDRYVEFGVPFWECSLDKAKILLEQALWSHLVTSRYAVPWMLERPSGLIVEVTDGDHFGWRGEWLYDLIKMSTIRLAFSMSRELVERPITALCVTPGFLRSEEMLEHFGVTEENWREGAKKDPHFIASETPLFVGRAVAALAADPEVGKKAGRVFSSWDLAKEYGFVDADGSRPDWKSHWERAFGSPYPTADAAAYATWFDGPVERWLNEQKARGEADPRGL